MTKRGCLVDGCPKPHDARGYCHEHYKRFMLHGDPLVVKQAPRGSGWLDAKGYRIFEKGGIRKPEHVSVAERALGKPLPAGAVVHHWDENPVNNEPGNLLVCPSPGYHKIIHMRMDALKACGNPNWRLCTFCGKYDDPQNMRDERARFVHRTCSNLAHLRHYHARKERARLAK